MKTFAQSLVLSVATALMLAAASTAIGSGLGAKGGAADLMGRKPTQATLATSTQLSGCPMTKRCPDCRTVTKTVAVSEGKGKMTKDLPVAQHLCAECKTTVSMTGHGKAKSTVSTHTCENATGKLASCCAK
jgi:hypothetical protein